MMAAVLLLIRFISAPHRSKRALLLSFMLSPPKLVIRDRSVEARSSASEGAVAKLSTVVPSPSSLLPGQWLSS